MFKNFTSEDDEKLSEEQETGLGASNKDSSEYPAGRDSGKPRESDGFVNKLRQRQKKEGKKPGDGDMPADDKASKGKDPSTKSTPDAGKDPVGLPPKEGGHAGGFSGVSQGGEGNLPSAGGSGGGGALPGAGEAAGAAQTGAQNTAQAGAGAGAKTASQKLSAVGDAVVAAEGLKEGGVDGCVKAGIGCASGILRVIVLIVTGGISALADFIWTVLRDILIKFWQPIAMFISILLILSVVTCTVVPFAILSGSPYIALKTLLQFGQRQLANALYTRLAESGEYKSEVLEYMNESGKYAVKDGNLYLKFLKTENTDTNRISGQRQIDLNDSDNYIYQAIGPVDSAEAQKEIKQFLAREFDPALSVKFQRIEQFWRTKFVTADILKEIVPDLQAESILDRLENDKEPLSPSEREALSSALVVDAKKENNIDKYILRFHSQFSNILRNRFDKQEDRVAYLRDIAWTTKDEVAANIKDFNKMNSDRARSLAITKDFSEKVTRGSGENYFKDINKEKIAVIAKEIGILVNLETMANIFDLKFWGEQSVKFLEKLNTSWVMILQRFLTWLVKMFTDSIPKAVEWLVTEMMPKLLSYLASLGFGGIMAILTRMFITGTFGFLKEIVDVVKKSGAFDKVLYMFRAFFEAFQMRILFGFVQTLQSIINLFELGIVTAEYIAKMMGNWFKKIPPDLLPNLLKASKYVFPSLKFLATMPVLLVQGNFSKAYAASSNFSSSGQVLGANALADIQDFLAGKTSQFTDVVKKAIGVSKGSERIFAHKYEMEINNKTKSGELGKPHEIIYSIIASILEPLLVKNIGKQWACLHDPILCGDSTSAPPAAFLGIFSNAYAKEIVSDNRAKPKSMFETIAYAIVTMYQSFARKVSQPPGAKDPIYAFKEKGVTGAKTTNKKEQPDVWYANYLEGDTDCLEGGYDCTVADVIPATEDISIAIEALGLDIKKSDFNILPSESRAYAKEARSFAERIVDVQKVGKPGKEKEIYVFRDWFTGGFRPIYRYSKDKIIEADKGKLPNIDSMVGEFLSEPKCSKDLKNNPQAAWNCMQVNESYNLDIPPREAGKRKTTLNPSTVPTNLNQLFEEAASVVSNNNIKINSGMLAALYLVENCKTKGKFGFDISSPDAVEEPCQVSSAGCQGPMQICTKYPDELAKLLGLASPAEIDYCRWRDSIYASALVVKYKILGNAYGAGVCKEGWTEECVRSVGAAYLGAACDTEKNKKHTAGCWTSKGMDYCDAAWDMYQAVTIDAEVEPVIPSLNPEAGAIVNNAALLAQHLEKCSSDGRHSFNCYDSEAPNCAQGSFGRSNVQCVGFVKDAYRCSEIDIPWRANAKDYCFGAKQYGGGKWSVVEGNKSVSIASGDIVVFGGESHGHVAVVSNVVKSEDGSSRISYYHANSNSTTGSMYGNADGSYSGAFGAGVLCYIRYNP